MALNLAFSLLTVFHLTYLGSMFDPGVDEQAVEEVGARASFSAERTAGGGVMVFVGPCRGTRPSIPSTAGPS